MVMVTWAWLSWLHVCTTCKLLVTVASTTKLGNELASQLEDEHSTRLVVNHNHMTVLVHGHALWPHKSTRAKLRLMDNKYKQREGRTINKIQDM